MTFDRAEKKKSTRPLSILVVRPGLLSSSSFVPQHWLAVLHNLVHILFSKLFISLE